ncbi:MAG: methyl-accepting chemotaxis protein [Rickettsiaceae bacterium]|nr:methyl-accepting chemotaxis protein [Rickettsiaceae bacterium]
MQINPPAEGRIRLKDLLNKGIENSTQNIIGSKPVHISDVQIIEPSVTHIETYEELEEVSSVSDKASVVKDWINKEKEKTKLASRPADEIYREVINSKNTIIDMQDVEVSEQSKPQPETIVEIIEETKEQAHVVQVVEEKISEYKIQGTVKVSSDTGKLIIEKMSDEEISTIATKEQKHKEINTPNLIFDDSAFQKNKGYQRPQDVLKDWLGIASVKHGSLDLVNKQLQEAAVSIVSGAADLNNKLAVITGNIQEQYKRAEEIVLIANSLQINGVNVGLSESLNRINNEIDLTTDKIQLLSQKAGLVAEALVNAQSHLAAVELYTTQVQKLAKQTNLLAINANIEAVRLGKDGSGFAIVASEIRELSKETLELSQSMGNKIDNAIGGLNQSNLALGEVNISNEALVKENISAIIQAIIEQNNKLINSVSENVNLYKHASDIAKSVDTKFQEESVKQITNIVPVLKILEAETANYKAAAVKSLGVEAYNSDYAKEVLDKILENITLEELKKKFLTIA